MTLEPPDPETGREATEAAGMYREDAYVFRKMDPIQLGKAVIEFFKR